MSVSFHADASASDFRTVCTQPAGEGCRADVTDLDPGTQYRFQVYAVNSQGASPAGSIGQSQCAMLDAVVAFSCTDLCALLTSSFCSEIL